MRTSLGINFLTPAFIAAAINGIWAGIAMPLMAQTMASCPRSASTSAGSSYAWRKIAWPSGCLAWDSGLVRIVMVKFAGDDFRAA